MFKMTATKILMAPAEEGADLGSAQDVESRIQAAMFGPGEETAEEEAVVDDGETLPEADDVEPDDSNEPKEPTGEEPEGDVTLASALGLDDDKLEYDDNGNVVFNAIIDGETHKVPMSDLVKSYQLQGHVNNKSIALENDRKEFHTTRDQAYQELATRLEGLNRLTQVAEGALLDEYNSIDWDALRAQNPGEWAALQQQYSQRAAQIEQIKSLAGQEGDRAKYEQQKKMQEQQAAFVAAEVQKMIQDNPTWSDQTVMAKDLGEIGAFLRNQYGFSDQEVANNLDARLMRLIKDAQSYHSGKKAVAEKKIPDNVPKFMKPGAGDRPSLQKARQVKAQKEAVRKSGGSTDSIAALLLDRM